jgi:hypothetical protein
MKENRVNFFINQLYFYDYTTRAFYISTMLKRIWNKCAFGWRTDIWISIGWSEDYKWIDFLIGPRNEWTKLVTELPSGSALFWLRIVSKKKV